MEPSPKGDNITYLPFDPTARATFLVGGVELRVAPYLVITPNTVLIASDRNDEGIRTPTDFHVRVTLFLDFE